MTENSLSADTVRAILQFRDDRNWASFHHPKDLALSISIEAAELLECFQWSGTDADVTEKRDRQAEELADVLIYGVLLADRLGIDLNAVVRAKLAKNAERYPADTCRKGSSDAERLDAYGRMKEEARSGSREEAPSPDVAPQPSPEEELLETLRTTASGYAKHLGSVRHRPGTWASDDENRIVFTRYTPETTDFWRELDVMRASVAGDGLLKTLSTARPFASTTFRPRNFVTSRPRTPLPSSSRCCAKNASKTAPGSAGPRGDVWRPSSLSLPRRKRTMTRPNPPRTTDHPKRSHQASRISRSPSAARRPSFEA